MNIKMFQVLIVNSLEAGMVTFTEPGIYVPGVAGVRIEDDILVTNEAIRSINTLRKIRSGIKMKSLLQAHSHSVKHCQYNIVAPKT